MTNHNQLPIRLDFDPFEGDLDAQTAWKHFGGLTLDQAYDRFSENPLLYQEDFMFMGHGALAYYFPVIDKYIRHGDDDRQALIIAQGLELQFQHDDTAQIDQLRPLIIDLAKFVIEKSHRFGDSDKERARISNAWRRLARSLVK